MWLYLLSILAIGSVESLTIGYPYRTLLSHDSMHSLGKVPAPQGFLIYLDNSGIERIVSFNYAEPVYAIQRINFIISEAAVVGNKFEKPDSSEGNEAREAHFRAWSLQQYQVLKREIDFLRGEGKEPSIEMSLKFLPLEKIALTADYSTIADLPEIRRIREEHLNIWKQILRADEEQNRSGSKSSIGNSKATTLEMEVQKIPHVEDFDELKQLKMSQTPDGKTGTIEVSSDGKIVNDQLDISKDSEALKNIKPEDKLTDKVNNKSEIVSTEDNIQISQSLEQTSETRISTTSTINKGNSKDINQELQADLKQIQVPDVKETNFNAIDDALKGKATKPELNNKKENLEKSSGTALIQGDYNPVPELLPILAETLEIKKGQEYESKVEMEANKQINTPQKIHSELQKLIAAAPTVYVPQQVVDTAEVMRARNEHLKIVNEAIQKAKLAQLQEKQRKAAAKMPEIATNATKVESIVATPNTEKHQA